MGKLIFVTGGARSGKSRFAESLAAQHERVRYIATAVAFDDEMRARIAKHRQSRPQSWLTCEGYRDVGRFLCEADAVLLDCITIMVTNLMMDEPVDWDHATPAEADEAERHIQAEIDSLIAAARNFAGTLIVVSNELGMGLVPVYPFGRIYRDIAGRVNQRLAAAADEAYLTVSGIPVKIKG